MARVPGPPTLAELRFLWGYRVPGAVEAMRRWGPHAVGAVALTSVFAMSAAGLPVLNAAWETAAMLTLNGSPADVEEAWASAHPEPMPTLLWALLWATRFAGPLLVGGALLDAATGLLPAPTSVPSGLRGHVVIVGGGRLGRWLAAAVRAAGWLVVVVDRSDDPDVEALRLQAFPVLRGDGTHTEALMRAGVGRAAAVFVATGHDEVNEHIGLLALALQEPDDDHLRLVVHSSRPDACLNTLRAWVPPGLASHVHTFDTYAEVARELVAAHPPAGWPRVIVGGYGRFGQAVLAELRRVGLSADQAVLLIDRTPRAPVPGTYQRVCDLLDESVVAMVTDDVPTLVFVCTDSDAHNLVFAYRVAAAEGARLHVVARTYEGPVDLPGVRPDGAVQVFSFVDILQRRLSDDIVAWLKGAV
jgi:Trk K+ transport system NAD-binding subunit